jgi:hypothetical protein
MSISFARHYLISQPPKFILLALLGAFPMARLIRYLILLSRAHLSSVTDIIDKAERALIG